VAVTEQEATQKFNIMATSTPNRVIKGALTGSVVIQPDRSVNETNDGTLEGRVTYRCDKEDEALLPQIGDEHPDDSRLECYNVSKSYNSNGLVTATLSFFGIAQTPETEPVISYTGGQNNDPIETHPNFADFAGTADVPLNGASFDDDGRFTGFLEDTYDDTTPQFRGLEYYLTPSTQITVSYWTDKVPNLKTRLQVYTKIPGVGGRDLKVPEDVENFLLLDTPFRQVGAFYQVTEQWLGSGPQGWNTEVYELASNA